MLRSPWLGPLVIAVAGVIGFVASGDPGGAVVVDDVEVSIRPTRDNGSPWDFGGGLPDPAIRVEQAGELLASCPAVKDQLEPRCHVGRAVDPARGPLRVIAVDDDTSDDDAIGELEVAVGATATGRGALVAARANAHGGAVGAWQRFRPLWIALALGGALALVLARIRTRARRR